MTSSNFHAFFSYVFLGVILAFILLLGSFKLFHIKNPKYRKELYILALTLPILAFFIFYIILDKQCSLGIYPVSFYTIFDTLCKIGITTGRYLIPAVLIVLFIGIIKTLLGRLYFNRLVRGSSLPKAEQVNRVEAIVKNRCNIWKLAIPKLLFTPRQDLAAVVIGVFKPTIVINTSLLDKLTDNELDMLLTHEIVHIKERDLFMGGVLSCFRDIMFFSPITTLIFKRYLLEREMYCDQQTAKVSGGKKVYAKTLLKVWSFLVEQKERIPITNAGFLDDKAHMELRIEKLISNDSKSNWSEDKNFFKVKLFFTTTLILFLWVIC